MNHIAPDEQTLSVAELLVRLDQARQDREDLLMAAAVVIVRNHDAPVNAVVSNVESAIRNLCAVAERVCPPVSR